MKISHIFIAALLILASCRNETEPKVADGEPTMVDTASQEMPSEITAPPYSVEYNETTQALGLIRSKENLSDLTTESILKVINKKYPGIQLSLVSRTADTVNLKIDDASKLTQEMGTAGAEAYLAEITYSLTEIKEVKAIKIDFEEGDHAMPGVYTRGDFKNLATAK